MFNIIIYAYDILQNRPKCDQASDYGQQLGALSGLLISLLEKFNLLHLTSQITQFLLIQKGISLILMKNHPIMPGWSFSSRSLLQYLYC